MISCKFTIPVYGLETNGIETLLTTFLGNATVAIKLLDEDKNRRKYYKVLFTKVGGNLINVQLYENTISSGFLFGTYNRQGMLLHHFCNKNLLLRLIIYEHLSCKFMCTVC